MKTGDTILDHDGNVLEVREQPSDRTVTLREVESEDEMTAPYFLPKQWLSGAVQGEQFLSLVEETDLEEEATLVDTSDRTIKVGDIDDSGLVSLFDFEDETIYYLKRGWVENGIEGRSSFELRRNSLPFLNFSGFDPEDEGSCD